VTLALHIDAQGAAADMCALIAEDSEFAAAWRAARERGVAVPSEVALHLYGYELLERLRDCVARQETRRLHAPFWPAALLVAGDVVAHAGDVLASMHPPLRVSWRAVPADVVEQRARGLFGSLPFDPEAYAVELANCAVRGRWAPR
jgi:hypothetical protein